MRDFNGPEDEEGSLAPEDGRKCCKGQRVKYEHRAEGDRSAHVISAIEQSEGVANEGDDESANAEDQKHPGES